MHNPTILFLTNISNGLN